MSKLAQAFLTAREAGSEYGVSATASQVTRTIAARVLRKGEPSPRTQIEATLRHEIGDDLLARLKQKVGARRRSPAL